MAKLEGKELQAARARALERAIENARAQVRAAKQLRGAKLVREILQDMADARDRPECALTSRPSHRPKHKPH